MRKLKHHYCGFTLVELLVVIVLIAILAGTVALSATSHIVPTLEKRIMADFRAINDAIKLFRLDIHRYPDSLEELVYQEDIVDWQGPYLDNPPFDPWKRPYIYEYTGDSPKPFILKTLGADGVEGGREENADWCNLDIYKDFASR